MNIRSMVISTEGGSPLSASVEDAKSSDLSPSVMQIMTRSLSEIRNVLNDTRRDRRDFNNPVELKKQEPYRIYFCTHHQKILVCAFDQTQKVDGIALATVFKQMTECSTSDQLLVALTKANFDKLKATKANTEQTIVIMKSNIEKAIARGERIDELLEKSESLKEHSETYFKATKRLRNKYETCGDKLASFFCCPYNFFCSDTSETSPTKREPLINEQPRTDDGPLPPPRERM